MTEFEIDELARAIAKELHERQMGEAEAPSSEPVAPSDRAALVELDFEA